MSTFDASFSGSGRARFKGRIDPAIVAACSDQPAEAAVIGALLNDDSLIDTAADRLRTEDFSDFLFGQIFATMLTMRAARQAASPITIAQRLKVDEDLIARGGARYLAELGMADTCDRGLGHVDHLVDLARRRFLAAAVAEIRPSFGDTGVPIESVVGSLEGALSHALFWSASKPAIGFANAWESVFDKIRAIKAGEVELGVTLPGLAEWDQICGGGMMAGQLIILGGRPGMGKTALALTVARRTAAAGHGVLFISREMPVEQLMFRMAADLMHHHGSTLTLDDLLNGRVSDVEFQRAGAIGATLANSGLVFEEPATLNVNRLGSLVRRHQRELAARGVTLKLVVVDYLQLLSPPENKANREQEVGEISREMKNIARSCGVTVLSLAQLNRGVESREDKRPLLSDLRDSGSIEQDADTVIFAYRAAYYLKQTEPDVTDTKKRDAWEIEWAAERDMLDIYSAKVRQGSTARRKIHFFGQSQAIRSADYWRTRGDDEAPL